MKVGSLFSGVGCGDLGLEWAGFEHAWFCEVNEYAREVLGLRWPGKPIYGDIKEVDFTAVEPVDVLAGGFPCQDISTAGTGAGIKGERSGLWSEFARAIAEIRPRYALIENSPALVTRGLGVVLSDLAALRYDAEWHCIPASAFGAPHKRDRIWIVAYTQCPERGTQLEACHGLESERANSIPQREESSGRLGGSGQAVADSAGIGRGKGWTESEIRGRLPNAGGDSCEVSYTMRPGRKELDLAALAARAGQHTGCAPAEWGKAWWSVEPELGRVAHGIAHRVDRLRGIGNGQVPQCTYYVGMLIQEHARATGYSKYSDNKEK